jgi:hypothetical protein
VEDVVFCKAEPQRPRIQPLTYMIFISHVVVPLRGRLRVVLNDKVPIEGKEGMTEVLRGLERADTTGTVSGLLSSL